MIHSLALAASEAQYTLEARHVSATFGRKIIGGKKTIKFFHDI